MTKDSTGFYGLIKSRLHKAGFTFLSIYLHAVKSGLSHYFRFFTTYSLARLQQMREHVQTVGSEETLEARKLGYSKKREN